MVGRRMMYAAAVPWQVWQAAAAKKAIQPQPLQKAACNAAAEAAEDYN